MTTEPGVLPKDYDELDFSKMRPIYAKTIYQVEDEVGRILKEEAANPDKDVDMGELKAVDFKTQSTEEVEAQLAKSKYLIIFR
jgi:hypothetical protein